MFHLRKRGAARAGGGQQGVRGPTGSPTNFAGQVGSLAPEPEPACARRLGAGLAALPLLAGRRAGRRARRGAYRPSTENASSTLPGIWK
jgi:hypothetical protein